MARDPEVVVLQKRLKDVGLYVGEVDGDFGPKTLAAALKGVEHLPIAIPVPPAVSPGSPLVLPAPGAPPLLARDREPFYSEIRQKFGRLSASQVDGFEHVLKEFDKSSLMRTEVMWREFLAYMLATAWHETAATMQPIDEYGKGRGKPYGKKNPVTGLIYYGRGLVQLTWYDNYKAYGIELDPERAKDPDFAAYIMIHGMTTGTFTTRKLSQYFSSKKNDPVGARAIINGKDKAQLIAVYHRSFLIAINALETVAGPAVAVS